MTVVAPTWAARWWRAVENHPNVLILGLVLLLAPLALLGVSLQMARWEERQVQITLQHARQALDAREQQAVIDFSLVRSSLGGLPEFMASEVRLVQALLQPQRREALRAATDYLDLIAGFFLVDLCLLIDAQGQTLAASSDEELEGLVGMDVSDRAYFKAAMAGRAGRQFAVGRRSGVLGLFLSAPVRTPSGDIVGAVVIKMDLTTLAGRLRMQGLFVEDEHGVVIMAQDLALLFRAAGDAPIHQESTAFRRNLYKRTEFPLLELLPAGVPGHPEVVLLGPSYRPVLHRRVPVAGDRLVIHLVEELGQLSTLQASHQVVLWVAWLGMLASLWAVCATSVFVLRGYRHRASIKAAHAELLQLNDQLKQQAESDFLTGCLNRRRFDEELDQEISRSLRQCYPLTLAVIDLDHFKRINDEHGHLVGDAALQHFARLVQEHVRQTDRLARLGGEEFALLMPDSDAAAAMQMLERLRQVLENTPLSLDGGGRLTITASIGVASLRKSDTHDLLVKRADHAMYQAKNAGRNRVVLAPGPQEEGERVSA